MAGTGTGFAPLRRSDPRQVGDGSFRLVARLGAGGMGVVYLGRSAGDELAAIKVIRPELGEDSTFRKRFLGEVEALTRVAAPFTARVLDAGVEGEAPWMATEYVPGPSLQSAVSYFGPLPEPSLQALWLGLLRALEHIHGVGLVHRDMKPSNVLLAADGPRVIDFGISQPVERSTAITRTGQVVGSPAYMSPEQARGEAVGPASDLFSLGSLMVYAASGTSPFAADSVPAIMMRLVGEEPTLGGVPASLREAVERCLAKDPNGRPDATRLLVGSVRLDSVEAAELLRSGRWLPEPVSAETRRRIRLARDSDQFSDRTVFTAGSAGRGDEDPGGTPLRTGTVPMGPELPPPPRMPRRVRRGWGRRLLGR